MLNLWNSLPLDTTERVSIWNNKTVNSLNRFEMTPTNTFFLFCFPGGFHEHFFPSRADRNAPGNVFEETFVLPPLIFGGSVRINN